MSAPRRRMTREQRVDVGWSMVKVTKPTHAMLKELARRRAAALRERGERRNPMPYSRDLVTMDDVVYELALRMLRELEQPRTKPKPVRALSGDSVNREDDRSPGNLGVDGERSRLELAPGDAWVSCELCEMPIVRSAGEPRICAPCSRQVARQAPAPSSDLSAIAASTGAEGASDTEPIHSESVRRPRG